MRVYFVGIGLPRDSIVGFFIVWLLSEGTQVVYNIPPLSLAERRSEVTAIALANVNSLASLDGSRISKDGIPFGRRLRRRSPFPCRRNGNSNHTNANRSFRKEQFTIILFFFDFD